MSSTYRLKLMDRAGADDEDQDRCMVVEGTMVAMTMMTMMVARAAVGVTIAVANDDT